MIDDEERKIQIRAKLTSELLDAFGSRPNEDAQTYGLLIAIVAATFVIWFGGKPNTDLITVLGMFAMLLGGCVILAGEISLASKLRNAAKSCLKKLPTKFWR